MSSSLLVILPHNPGDVVMALAAVARLKAALPDFAVDYVVGEECRELAEGNPLLRQVHPLPRSGLRDRWAAGDAAGVLDRLETWIAGVNASPRAYSLNLYQERYGGLLQALVSADRKSGLELLDGRWFAVASRALQHLFAIPASRSDNGWHAVDLYLRAARALVAPTTVVPWPQGLLPSLPPLVPPPGWNGPAPESFLAFHPGSAWPGKKWPERHWAALAVACAGAQVPVVLTGSAEERSVAGRILDAVPPGARRWIHDWSGRTTLIGAAWIQAQARMAVTGDTVAMHLAAAVGTPTVALFGPSNPVETGPYGKGHFVFQTDLGLAADLDLTREHPGLAALTPETVAGFILEGAVPAGTPLWETDWDADHDMQILRDPKGTLHPDQARSRPLLDLLDGRRSAEPTRPLTGPYKKVQEALDHCLLRGSRPADLLDLESADRDLASATRDSLVWEAYRIAVNGLPLEDIRQYLELRQARFQAALREDSTLRTV